jgi:hypothetical protein
VIDLDEIKSRINLAYQEVRGTESHERKILCDEIERLRAENEQLSRILTAGESHCRDLIERNEALKAALQHEKDVAEAYKAEADALSAAIQAGAGSEQRTCNWTHNDDDGYWAGDCGIAFCLENETPELNEMYYCPKCGGKLEVKE